MQKSLGILGGLGPLASAEFLKTIYEFNITDSEQESPICFLYSNPTFPKRTEAIAAGADDILISSLVKALESLCQLGSSKIVIVCVTIHYFLPKVPLPLKEKVISLIDLIIEEVLHAPKKYLLLCSNGARKTNIFQRHNRWNQVEPYIVFPDDEDQNIIHNCFEEVKINGSKDSTIHYLDKTIQKYSVDAFIAGCSELHIVNKHLRKLEYKKRNYPLIDPLLTVAQNFKQIMDL